MNEPHLFTDKNGKQLRKSDFDRILKNIVGDNTSILYVHTGLNFGKPNMEISRNYIIESLFDSIMSLGSENLVLPTFTFSFCNGENFSVNESKSFMGSLNEHARKHKDFVRSSDPLMSVALSGPKKELLASGNLESIGAGSTFDVIRNSANVKFMFFGVELGDCFTYMHYLEWLAGVPYRYNRTFTGNVISSDGKTTEQTHSLFVRYGNVYPNQASHDYALELKELGALEQERVGDSTISVTDEKPASSLYLDILKSNPNAFIEGNFDPQTADNTFQTTKRMVAL